MLLLACVGLVGGAVTMSVSYSWAATHGSGQLQFHLFWVAEFLFLVPAILRLLSRYASRAERLGLLVMIGLFDYLPKFLRDPSAPLFHDEALHWRETQVIFASGRAFVPSPIIRIIEFFPGLHIVTAELRQLTGLSTFQVGSILLALLHVFALIGIFLIAERLTRSSMIAGIAALIYSLNPSFMFFDSQYAYESLAIVLFIWVVCCVVGMQTARGELDDGKAWFSIGLVLAAGCIVTHHLTTYALVLLLLVTAAVTAVRNLPWWRSLAVSQRVHFHDVVARGLRGRLTGEDLGLLRSLRGWSGEASERREALYLTGVFAILVLAGAAAWLFFVAPGTFAYLSPHVLGGLHQIVALIHHQQGPRQLFHKSVDPFYERLAAFLTPVVLALGAAGGLLLLWRSRRRVHNASIALALFGLIYFPSVPLMLTQAGSEGARRAWVFTYVGLSVLSAPLVAAALNRARLRRLQYAVVTGLVVALLGVILIGNVSVQISSDYRFPGPYVYGSDTEPLNPEFLGMAQWFRATQGTNRKVVADRSSALVLAAFADEAPATASQGFPIWELYFSTGLPSSTLLSELVSSNYRYMVIDRRMSRNLPVIGVYFEPNEPGASTRTSPPPAAALEKYQYLPWVTKIYASDNLEVYRFDFGSYRARPAISRVGPELQPGMVQRP